MQEVVAIMFISLNAAIGILLLTFACAYSKFQTSKGACWILFVVVFYAVTMMLEVTEKKLRRVLKAVISDSNFSAWVKKHKIAVLFADLIADALVFTKSGSVLSAFAMPIVMARAQIAVAAAASRILFHPMLVLSEHVGKCFKLIFSEVPVQWQPFVFIAIFLLVLLFLGIEISGPLMQIGKHGQVKGQLDAERQKNRELKSEIDKLHRRLELTRQNAERAVDYQPANYVENVPKVPQGNRNQKQPVENKYTADVSNEGTATVVNEQLDSDALQETESETVGCTSEFGTSSTGQLDMGSIQHHPK